MADEDLENFIREQIPKIARMGGTVTARDVQRNFWKFRRGGQCLLDCMVQRGYGMWVERRSGAKGGRPTRVFSLFDKWCIDETTEFPAEQGNQSTEDQ